MFYYLNKSWIAQFVVIILLLAWAVFTIVTSLTVGPMEGQTLLFGTLTSFWTEHPVNAKVVAIALLLLETILLALFYANNRFAETRTYMPVVFFLLLMNLGGFLKMLTPAYITTFFITLIILNTLDDNDKPVKNRVFASGLLIGICSLIDPSSLGLLLFLLLALITHRFSKSKEIIILFFALLFVYAYVVCFFFFTDNMAGLTASLKTLSFFGVVKSLKTLTLYDYLFLGFATLFAVYLIIQLKLLFDNKLIVLRKRLVNIHFLLFAVVGMLLISGLQLQQGLVYIAIPISLYFSMITQQKTRIILHDILIIAFYVLLWL